MRYFNKHAVTANRMAFNTKFVGLGAVAIAAAVFATPSKGALILTLSEPGYGSVTGTVTGNTDTFSGTFGDFTTNVVIGYSNSATPGPLAQLQVQSLDVAKNSNSAAAVLTITMTDTTYNFPGTLGTPLLLTSSLGGTISASQAGDSVTFKSTATPSVGPSVTSGVQTYVAPSTPPGSLAFVVPQSTTSFAQTGSYGLTSQIVASLSGPNETANLSGSTTVAVAPAPIPEPAGIACVAVASIGLLSRRRLLA